MATNIYDDALPTAGELALIELSGGATDTTFIGINVASAAPADAGKIGLKASNSQRIFISTSGSVTGAGKALDLGGIGSRVYNEGILNQGFVEGTSLASTGIVFTGGGTSEVTNRGTINGTKGIEVASSTVGTHALLLFNSGTIATSGLAIQGGFGSDRIINTGTISTTGAVLMDLGNGNDFYDGRAPGIATGTIKLGEGDDTAFGGNGNQTFIGGTGSNYIDGGSGTDTIDYSGSLATLGVAVNLALTGSQGITNATSDVLLGIENVIGSALSDTLVGNSGQNFLSGGAGNDTLDGGSGSFNDTLDGGGDNDTVRFSGLTAATVNLSLAAAQATGFGTDLLIGIENLIGGSGADTFTGNGQANRLTGNSGNDTLKGGGGDDTLEGGSGNDTAVFSGTSTEYVRTDLGGGKFRMQDKQSGRDGVDDLSDIRFAQFSDRKVALVNASPTLINPTSATLIESTAVGSTVATLFGSDPDGDTLSYSLVSDAGGMFGLAAGNKLVLKHSLNFEAAKKYIVTVRASDGYGGELTKAITINVSNAVETTPLVLRGTKASEQLVGEAGGDRLYGFSGNDTLFGQVGNDRLYGGSGKDGLVGGLGRDAFVLDTKPTRSSIDTIYDFKPVDDTIWLPKAVFKTLAKKGTLSKGAFVVGDRVYDADDRIIYLKKAGALFYDPDGTGAAQAYQIASVTKNLALTHKDFYVI